MMMMMMMMMMVMMMMMTYDSTIWNSSPGNCRRSLPRVQSSSSSSLIYICVLIMKMKFSALKTATP